ncbi:Ppx/GppA family phosphatase [Paenibacillus farraposensis]|uniref:Ppx/GppA family phosphatase n=1 Tax=Paenibacillus farraposensis TaxID=2807095 RepID=A0ABW4DGM1_9BACL|nr:Ppx/GppA phosphatase family protein [Paenibacillus farraposensis]MCC3378605.1 Ppx/GppA family phosphatase [Paenibacillus farraposensis]
MNSKIGIMDIGSNSIRLVIYEMTETGAYRIVQECKEAARLSEKVGANGRMERDAIRSIAPLLRQFMTVCRMHEVARLRAAATAAIRNAANPDEIVQWIAEETGLTLEILSGEQEGYAGFLGVVNTMDVSDGIIIDIGGGSTEITLFRERKRLHTVSFPFGAVNMNWRFGREVKNGEWSLQQIEEMETFVRSSLQNHDWIFSNPGLPFIGLGGTLRTLAKINQKRLDYSLPVTHHYEMAIEDVDYFYTTLPYLSYEKRKKTAGLSKDRADIIVPGLIILKTIFEAAQGIAYLVSGAGLRDGLFHELVHSAQPVAANPLVTSIRNILSFGVPVSEAHVKRVHGYAVQLYDALAKTSTAMDKRLLLTAATLYKTGAVLNYYHFRQHSVFWILHAGIGGLSHRETVLSALIADYHPKNRTSRLLRIHADILEPSDEERVHKLGSLLQLAIGMDRSESGMITSIHPTNGDDALHIRLESESEPILEQRELVAAAKDFQKAWNLTLSWSILPSSNF